MRDRLFDTGSAAANADGGRRDVFPVAIGRNEGLALRDWVIRERARRTVEIGLGFAVSTLFILDGLLENRDGRHVAMDPYQFTSLPIHTTTYAGAGLQILEEAGVRDLVEFVPEESQVALPRFLAEGRRFDFAFVDGNHRFEAAFLDLIYCGRLLDEGRIVFVDDTQLPGIAAAVRFCSSNLGWRIEDQGEEPSHAWCVLRTGSKDVFQRSMSEFTDFSIEPERT